MPFPFVKAHALGNDFILVDEAMLDDAADRVALARAICERHRGVGADGLMLYRMTAAGAAMQLLNADGSYSEISGNGVRCLAAWVVAQRGGDAVDVETDAGTKHLTVVAQHGGRVTFRAAMGQPESVTLETLRVDGGEVEAVTLRVGNPQCVVLGEVSEHRLHTLAAALAVHSRFPEGTNVELATVEDPGRVRILIWERGVGPTEASGTGACAAAVAAIAHGGARHELDVVSPGGTQRVEWSDAGLFLTGWAEVIARGIWVAGGAGAW